MNQSRLWLLAILVTLGLNARCFALDYFKKQFTEKYASGADANPELKTAVEKAKCKVCHVGPMAVRNDYGKTLSKWLVKGAFTKEKIDADPEGKKKAVMDALDLAEKEASPAGGTYGERLKAGLLPGTVEKKE